jgi:hypothetical protein
MTNWCKNLVTIIYLPFADVSYGVNRYRNVVFALRPFIPIKWRASLRVRDLRSD